MKLQIFDDVRPELVPFLRDTILERASKTPSQGSNNIGGWKSTIDFFDWPGLEIQKLHAELFARIGGYPVGWAMVNRAGSQHRRHTHGFHYTCGVYYVAAGDPAVPTVFEIPSPGTRGEFGGFGDEVMMASDHKFERHIRPIPGRIVIFPGSMFHRVPVYSGNEPRISVAFELRP